MNSIDTAKKPYIPEGWKVESHDISMGSIEFKDISTHLEEEQRNGYISGEKLRERLKDKPVLNANVLDYLLKHPHLIPEDWKKDESGNTRYIFFWGTIYRSSGDYLYVRYLCWYGGAWDWSYRWLGNGFHGHGPAALRASMSTQASGSLSDTSAPLNFDPLEIEISYRGKKYKIVSNE